jgi:hypothetical protein
MVVGMEVGFGRRFGVSLRLDADVGWPFLVASSGLCSGLEHGGHQMLGSNSIKLFVPEHRKNANVNRQKVGSKGVNCSLDRNTCARSLPSPF